ncbi:MAG: hypothetical protein EBY57_03140 [Actinobacteria bacterium]|nr:hypothetical protein [Actinomycetota bacterium]
MLSSLVNVRNPVIDIKARIVTQVAFLMSANFACTCDRALTAIHHDRSAEMKVAYHIGRK